MMPHYQEQPVMATKMYLLGSGVTILHFHEVLHMYSIFTI